MNKEDVLNIINRLGDEIIGKPISKDWPTHLIRGFGIEEPAPGNFELYVIGQDEHGFSSFRKLLSQWQIDNDEI